MKKQPDNNDDDLEAMLRDYYSSRHAQAGKTDRVWRRLSRELYPTYTGPEPEHLRNRFMQWGVTLVFLAAITVMLIDSGFFGGTQPTQTANIPNWNDGRPVAGVGAARMPAACNSTASLDCALQSHTETAEIMASGLAEEIRFPRTVDKWTVNLQVVYADPRTIMLGYTVSGPDVDRYLQPITPTLTTVQGEGFTLLRRSASLVKGPDGEMVQEAGEVNIFSGPGTMPKSGQLQITFVIPGLILGSETADGVKPTRVASALVPVSDVIPGPFVYTMYVPVQP